MDMRRKDATKHLGAEEPSTEQKCRLADDAIQRRNVGIQYRRKIKNLTSASLYRARNEKRRIRNKF